MTKIVSLSEARNERTPHFVGPMLCLRCKHTWQGNYPMPTKDWYDCPECGTNKGVVSNPFGGANEYICPCDCAHFAFVKQNLAAPTIIRCRNCGMDHPADKVFT